RPLFTSDLSVDEALLLEEIGFEPLELVVGTCHYHIGYQLASWSKNEEMTTLTAAMHQARAVAMSRMEAQVRAAGAGGVIGVRLTVGHHGHHAEFSVLGTAVRCFGDNAAWRVGGRPFTSDLSGQDFYALARGGFGPRALVMGNCVYHVAHQGLGQWLGT